MQQTVCYDVLYHWPKEDMYMRLKEPTQVRQLFAERKNWLTIEEIATGMGKSTRTISKAFRGKPLRPETVREFAGMLDVKETEIATFIAAN
jgi:cyanate lyase